MDLRDIMKVQEKFDRDHRKFSDCSVKITEKNLEVLEFLMICMVGEFGEFANSVKKVIRGDFLLDSKKGEIEGEIADIFIYLLKICNQMDLDLEKIFLAKIEKNMEKFKGQE